MKRTLTKQDVVRCSYPLLTSGFLLLISFWGLHLEPDMSVAQRRVPGEGIKNPKSKEEEREFTLGVPPFCLWGGNLMVDPWVPKDENGVDRSP